MDIKPALQQLLNRQDLEPGDMKILMRAIMSGGATPAQIGALLTALRAKGESIREIVAAAQVLREMATKVPVQGKHLIDTCGTGGDALKTFNISTTAAFVVAAAGGQVAKHGNRSVSGNSGSADVLEAAGVNLDLTPEQVRYCIETAGVGFLFAQRHHGAMKYAIGPRRELGIRTLFNLLGPLPNPAGAPNQLLGIHAGHQQVEDMAEVMRQLGSQHVLVVNAEDGLDEISIAASTRVAELKDGQISSYHVTPEQFGLRRSSLSDIAVDTVGASLHMMKQVLQGQPGAARDITLLNAGAAIYAANLCSDMAGGITMAATVIDSGAAREKLDALIRISQSFHPSRSSHH